MHVSALQDVLNQFSPSMKLVMKANGETREETTVLQLMMQLIGKEPENIIRFCGHRSFILREHPLAPPERSWLSMNWVD